MAGDANRIPMRYKMFLAEWGWGNATEPPDAFVRACLENDLAEAVAALVVVPQSELILLDMVEAIRQLPAQCRGSKNAVSRWLERAERAGFTPRRGRWPSKRKSGG